MPKEQSKPTGKIVLRPKSKQGPAALPEVKVFSFSQISLYRKCPLEYKYRHILRLPTPGAASLSFGQTIHATLEKYLRLTLQEPAQTDLFGGKPDTGKPDLESLRQIYGESWVDDWYDTRSQMDEYRQKGERLLKVFYEEIIANPPHPKFLEQKFKLKLGEYWVSGKIDRGDIGPEGLTIIDYKTGPPRGIFKVDKEQLLLYQWAVEEFLKEKVASLQYWFLWDSLKKESFIGAQKDLEAFKREFLATIEDIVEATHGDSFAEKDQRISHDCKFRDIGL